MWNDVENGELMPEALERSGLTQNKNAFDPVAGGEVVGNCQDANTCALIKTMAFLCDVVRSFFDRSIVSPTSEPLRLMNTQEFCARADPIIQVN